MFGFHRRQKTTDRASAEASVNSPSLTTTPKAPRHRAAPRPPAEDRGFTGLEGDFEAERRRAVGSERVEPYEHDEKPHLPGGWSGVTHP
ncbi:hypothetical protein JF66_06015 [Cryobacterium sp. MLB-32]|uniref:hypothetical protein n=1 Tax=Cryobacterium sp. MLB-32 TaxID=1529318 RepID=UPI0004E7653D|nr:hypothetical protein [Cryobacterium sp. MLB-32]KFF60201.1 hypothetical protein JF66_06015 [Cryobacterium sp. MLB-32]